MLTQPGVEWLFVSEGINDLGGGKPSVEGLLTSYDQIIIRARDGGLRVYGSTILPCGDSCYASPELEGKRQRTNH